MPDEWRAYRFGPGELSHLQVYYTEENWDEDHTGWVFEFIDDLASHGVAFGYSEIGTRKSDNGIRLALPTKSIQLVKELAENNYHFYVDVDENLPMGYTSGPGINDGFCILPVISDADIFLLVPAQ